MLKVRVKRIRALRGGRVSVKLHAGRTSISKRSRGDRAFPKLPLLLLMGGSRGPRRHVCRSARRRDRRAAEISGCSRRGSRQGINSSRLAGPNCIMKMGKHGSRGWGSKIDVDVARTGRSGLDSGDWGRQTRREVLRGRGRRRRLVIP